MPRCEDYPCCGHENGDCPRITASGRQVFRCVGGCGRELPRGATSSICKGCMRAAERRAARGEDMWPDEEGR